MLDLPQRATEAGALVTDLVDGGADRGGADLRPRRVVQATCHVTPCTFRLG